MHDRPAGTISAKCFSPLGEIVRRHDRDRFLTAPLALADAREPLSVRYASNDELARVIMNSHARETASSAELALIRLRLVACDSARASLPTVTDGQRAAMANDLLDRDMLICLNWEA